MDKKLYAISDLHLDYDKNKSLVSKLDNYPRDHLIIAGDISHNPILFDEGLSVISKKFNTVFWVPGNHDLWSIDLKEEGVSKYLLCCQICEKYGVLTPEDEYQVWRYQDTEVVIAPCFTLYDYSFRPNDIALNQAIYWAKELGIICADEYYLKTTPYQGVIEWCNERVEMTESRLDKVKSRSLVIVNHYPLVESLLTLYRVPRFSIWSGTKQTASWLSKYKIHTMVYGHSHVRNESMLGQTRCCEVSLGYPKQQYKGGNINDYLVQIL